MADTTPTPEPSPEHQPNPARGIINQTWLDELTLADALIAIAKEPESAELIIDEDKPTFLNDLHTDICTGRTLASKAMQKTTGKRQATTLEDAAETKLIRAMDVVRKRAKQKYSASDKAAMKGYFIGMDISKKRSLLEQAGQTFLDKLNGTSAIPADKLPGIDAVKIAAIATALEAYKLTQTSQGNEQSDATTARNQLEELIFGKEGIAARRRQIQFAADAQWPHTDPTNAGIRAKFGLPKDRALKG